jgi:hypothetical protein
VDCPGRGLQTLTLILPPALTAVSTDGINGFVERWPENSKSEICVNLRDLRVVCVGG